MPGTNRDGLKSKFRALSRVISIVFLILSVAAALADSSPGRFQPGVLFPGVEGPIELKPLDALPGLAAALVKGKTIGYAFSTSEVINSVGYSGKPLDIEVGLLLDGHISGVRLAHHEEPILVIGVTAADLDKLVKGLAGADIRQSASARRVRQGQIDHIAGATISSTVIRDAVFRAARRVASVMGIAGMGGGGRQRVDLSRFEPNSWDQLLDEKAIARLTVTRGEAAALSGRPEAEPGALFIDLYVALLTPALIGQNLLGKQDFEHVAAELAAGSHAILIAANGLYSFKGTAYRQTGHFDRIQLVQGALTIQLKAEGYRNLAKLAAKGAPEFREIGIFPVPGNSGFDPAEPWQLELLAHDSMNNEPTQPAVFQLPYRLPPALILSSAGASAPVERALWEEIWERRQPEIAAAATMLAVLAVILLFQDALTSRVQLYRWTRLAFLAATLLFLGFYAGAQLSVVNVVTFSQGLLQGFKWDNFLLDPIIFILWSFVALALLFWGRGVFCGWLCPFGALQELLNEGARKLGVKQIQVPWPLHERLWPIKYIAFLLILGLSLNSVTEAFKAAEIEPFKTVIALKFQRELPFVAYAAALLFAGLFIERFFCRYLCPLGAGLAIPAKLKLFDWLKRRTQCGVECHICEVRCTVQAIDPIGRINPNECIYCLRCQANYHDSETCMVLVRRRTRHQAPSVAPLKTRTPSGGQA